MKVALNDMLLIGFAVMLTLQINSCFSKVHKPESMIRNEEKIKAYESELPKIKQQLSDITAKYDSLLLVSAERILQLSQAYKATKIYYEKIPVIVGNLDKEQLRSGANNY